MPRQTKPRPPTRSAGTIDDAITWARAHAIDALGDLARARNHTGATRRMLLSAACLQLDHALVQATKASAIGEKASAARTRRKDSRP